MITNTTSFPAPSQSPLPAAISGLREDRKIHPGKDSEPDPNLMSFPAGLPSAKPTKSYWLQNLSPVLEGHRTTPELPAEADVVVVGSGITGAFAAWFLQMGVDDDLEEEEHLHERKKANQNVVMLEAREACSGATGRNGGHCQPQVYFSPTTAGFELETYHFLEKLINKYHIPCDWVSQSGVHVYLSQDTFDYVRDSIEELKETYPHLAAQVTVISPTSSDSDDETNSASPETQAENNKPQPKQTLSSLRIPHAKGAIIQQHAASLWPYKLVSWLLEHLLSKFTPEEFNLQTNTPVTSLRRVFQADTPISAGNSFRWLLSTPRGSILANKVILATNGYTSYLLPKMGGLIFPVRGQVAALLPPGFSQRITTSPQQSFQEIAVKTENRLTDNHTKGEQGIVKLDHTYIYLASEPGEEGYNTKEDYLIQRPIRSVPVPQGEQSSQEGGEYIFGGGRDFASSPAYGFGEWRDDTIDQDVSQYLRGHLSPPLDLRPDIQNGRGDTIRNKTMPLKATYQWTGIMGYTHDGDPFVGPVPAGLLPDNEPAGSGNQHKNVATGSEGRGEGVWLCAGYNGHGMPVAALSARAVVAQVLDLSSSSPRPGDCNRETLPEEFRLTEERVRVS